MGWFSKSKQSSSVTREDREKCWEKRDQYFQCLDHIKVLEAGKEGEACAKERISYQESCAKSWIEYFNQRRKLAQQQKDVLAQVQTQAQAAKHK